MFENPSDVGKLKRTNLGSQPIAELNAVPRKMA
jgi:hypothetical protein